MRHEKRGVRHEKRGERAERVSHPGRRDGRNAESTFGEDRSRTDEGKKLEGRKAGTGPQCKKPCLMTKRGDFLVLYRMKTTKKMLDSHRHYWLSCSPHGQPGLDTRQKVWRHTNRSMMKFSVAP